MKVKKKYTFGKNTAFKNGFRTAFVQIVFKSRTLPACIFFTYKKNFIQSKFQKIFIDKSWQKAHTSMQKILQKSLHLQLYLKSNLEEKLWHKHNGTI